MEQEKEDGKEASSTKTEDQHLMEEEGACGPVPPASSLEPIAGTSKSCQDLGPDEISWRLSVIFRDTLSPMDEEEGELDNMELLKSGKEEYPGLAKNQLKYYKEKKAGINRKLARVEPIAELSMEDDSYEPKSPQEDQPNQPDGSVMEKKRRGSSGDIDPHVALDEMHNDPRARIGDRKEVQVGEKRKAEDSGSDSEASSNDWDMEVETNLNDTLKNNGA